jgi:diguanylate cyclase
MDRAAERTGRPTSGRLDLFVVATVLAAATCLIAAIGDGNLVPSNFRGAFIIFAALVFVGELKMVTWLWTSADAQITMSWGFAIACLMFDGWAPTLVVVATASIIADITQRKPLVRVAFNASQIVVSLTTCWIVLRWVVGETGLSPDHAIDLRWLIGFVLAGTALLLVNALLACTAVALHEGRSVARALRTDAGENLYADGALVALAPLFVVVAQRSLWLLPLALITAVVVYRSALSAQAHQHASRHDPLTGLLNRRAFLQQMELLPGSGVVNAVVIIDLDNFKEVNDRLGHHVGDQVLQAVGLQLVGERLPDRYVARLGGDEFAVLLTGVRTRERAIQLAWNIHSAIERSASHLDIPVRVTGSVGIALSPEHGDSIPDLMRSADLAMYAAKQSRSGVQMYNPSDQARDRGRLSLLPELADAITDGELTFRYQPIVSALTGDAVKFEALIRWEHPRSGLIAPGEFIPLAEHTELMGPLTAYVLEHTIRACSDWLRGGLEAGVAINVSSHNLREMAFVDTVREALARHGVPARYLEIEVTENTVIANPERAQAVLKGLKNLGVTLALDDFGTGYSSLAHLRNLPIDAIKIDRSFVSSVVTEVHDREVVRSVTELAHRLGLFTVAEGVEDDATRLTLQQLGCDYLQGHLVSLPMQASELADWVAARQVTGRP